MSETGAVDLAASSSGLERSESGSLHHPHQQRDGAPPGTKYTSVLAFDQTNGFGGDNTIYLPPIPMVVTDLWAEVELGAVTGPTNPYILPTDLWVRQAHVHYVRNNLLTITEPEVLHDSLFNNKNNGDMIRRFDACNRVPVATAQTRAGGVWLYYVPLRVLADTIFSKVGAISAYPAQTWSITLSMTALASLVKGDTATAGAATINNIRLVMVGHKENPANITEVEQNIQAKDAKGLTIRFEQSHYKRFSYAASTTRALQTFPEIQGEVAQILMVHRVTASHDSTAPNAVNREAYQIFDAVGDTISIGTTSSSVSVYGTALPMRLARLVGLGESYSGAASYMDETGALRQTGWVCVSFEDAATLGKREAVFSGVLRVGGDLLITHDFATTTTANYLDVVVTLRRAITLAAKGFTVINEE